MSPSGERGASAIRRFVQQSRYNAAMLRVSRKIQAIATFVFGLLVVVPSIVLIAAVLAVLTLALPERRR
jgi:hypothetical protein